MTEEPNLEHWEHISSKILTEKESEILVQLNYNGGIITIDFKNTKTGVGWTFVPTKYDKPISILRAKIRKQNSKRKFPFELESFEVNAGLVKAKFNRKTS